MPRDSRCRASSSNPLCKAPSRWSPHNPAVGIPVASDTWAFEAVPSKTPLWLPLHAVGIVYMGLMIGENFLLDEWANDCAADGVYEAFMCAGPIPFSRAVGAPVNPIVAK